RPTANSRESASRSVTVPLSSLFPNILDFDVPPQRRFSVRPRKRCHIGGAAYFEAGSRDVLLVGPGNARDVMVFHPDSIERLGSRPLEEWGCRGLVEKHFQEGSFFRCQD